MDVTGVKWLNDYYVKTPSAVLKAAELVLGFGVWGSVVAQPVPGNAAYAFFVWVTLSSWLVVLVTYLLGLFRLSMRPQTQEELKEFEAPQLADLIVNAIIATLYIPAIIVFSVTFPKIPGWTVVSFVIAISVVTFLVHTFHASTLVLYMQLGSARWPNERQWVWEALRSNVCRPRKQGQSSAKYAADVPTVVHASSADATEPQNANQESGNDIYQDLS